MFPKIPLTFLPSNGASYKFSKQEEANMRLNSHNDSTKIQNYFYNWAHKTLQDEGFQVQILSVQQLAQKITITVGNFSSLSPFVRSTLMAALQWRNNAENQEVLRAVNSTSNPLASVMRDTLRQRISCLNLGTLLTPWNETQKKNGKTSHIRVFSETTLSARTQTVQQCGESAAKVLKISLPKLSDLQLVAATFTYRTGFVDIRIDFRPVKVELEHFPIPKDGAIDLQQYVQTVFDKERKNFYVASAVLSSGKLLVDIGVEVPQSLRDALIQTNPINAILGEYLDNKVRLRVLNRVCMNFHRYYSDQVENNGYLQIYVKGADEILVTSYSLFTDLQTSLANSSFMDFLAHA